MRIEEYISKAKNYLTQGNVREAIAICQEVIDRQPDAIAAYLTLGEALEAHGDPTGARDAYVKVLEIEPRSAVAHGYLGQLYAEYWWLDEAVENYQQALIIKPDWTEVYYNLGNVFHKQGNLSAAVDSYRKAISLRSNYADAYYNLAVVFDQQNELAAAVESYTKVIAIAPKYIKAYSNLGCLLVKQGKVAEAIAIYQKGIAVKPDWATLYNNFGQVLLENNPEEAILAYHKAIELEPEMELAYYNLGKAWQMQGVHEKAVPYFQQVIELNPDYISAYTDSGFSLMALGKIAEAMPYFQKAINLKPEFVEAYCDWVEMKAIASTSSQTIDELGQAQAACYQFIRALMGAKAEGRRQREEGRGKKAEEIIDLRLEDKIKLAIADYLPVTNYQLPITDICEYLTRIYLHLGNALVEYGGYKQADIYYQQALQIQPNNAEIYWKLGNSLAKQRRGNAAISLYHIALAIQPQSPGVYFDLGNVLEKQQRYKQAIDYYEKVLNCQSLGESGNSKFLPRSNYGNTQLPKGIYLSSYDWMSANKLEASNYFEINCKDSENITNHPAKITDHQLPKSDCGGLTCQPCLKRISDWFEPIHLGWGIHLLSHSQSMPIKPPKTFVTIIPEGRAWMVPQKSYWLLCSAMAVISPDNYLLADISRDYPGFLPGCEKHDLTKHSVFQLESLPNLEPIDGTVAVLSGLSGNVYFHWMVDVLPRLELLRLSGIDFEQIDWFLVNNSQQPFQQETLKALGVPLNKILASDDHPHIQAKQLIVPSFPGYLGWPSLWVIDFLRRVFLAGITPLNSYPERIYISRSKARYRRVLNEEEVMDELSKFGFVRVFLESLPLQEQIALFFHAKVIVAPHGSGLTNTMFCQTGTKVIELVSPHYVGHYFWASSYHLRLKHYYLIGEVFECYPIRQLMYQNSLTEDILVNLSVLKKMMEIVSL
jgi:tetratricopeptide (TPR) repeat protein/capsular polysaccharide biosynthesis protein